MRTELGTDSGGDRTGPGGEQVGGPPRASIHVTHHGNCCRLVMSMGNYLRKQDVRMGVMAASDQPVGVDHPTIVPENFEADARDREENGEPAEN